MEADCARKMAALVGRTTKQALLRAKPALGNQQVKYISRKIKNMNRTVEFFSAIYL